MLKKTLFTGEANGLYIAFTGGAFIWHAGEFSMGFYHDVALLCVAEGLWSYWAELVH